MIVFPTFAELVWATLKAIKILGGPSSNKDIVQKVIQQEGYPENIQNKMHTSGNLTKLEYSIRWSQSFLKNNWSFRK